MVIDDVDDSLIQFPDIHDVRLDGGERLIANRIRFKFAATAARSAAVKRRGGTGSRCALEDGRVSVGAEIFGGKKSIEKCMNESTLESINQSINH